MVERDAYVDGSASRSMSDGGVMKRVGSRRAGAVGLTALLIVISGCSQLNDNDVHEYVDQAIAVLSQGYYADSSTWDEAVEEALPGLYAAKSIPHTYGTLGRLTKVAGGRHSFFSTPAAIAAMENPYPPGSLPMPTVMYDGMVAMITIPGFSSDRQSEIDQYVGAAASAFGSERAHTACGWIIDLRNNGGGDLFTMLAAVSPLLDDGDVEAFRDRDGSTANVNVSGNTVTWDGQEWGSLPGKPTKLAGRPIAILQSRVTASAAESVIISFAGQQGVETFGSKTGGFTTVNRGFELPDGAVVTLSFALMGDREGNFYEGSIAPDHNTDGPRVGTLKAAQDWMADQCSDL